MQPAADRNLLFGILAVQMDFITRDQLIAAMHAWVLDKTKPLGAILVEQEALSSERHTLLDALVVEHLKQHDNDPQQSLAALTSVGSIKKDLEQISDPDVQATVGLVPTNSAKTVDPYATVAPAAGTPTSIGTRFRILRPHARGGLGEVFVAEDAELHREVALKEIQDRHADNQESRLRFVLEAEITGGLEHPGIVPVYGLGQYADGRPFYAMRFIKGDSLKDAIERFHQGEPGAFATGERTLDLRQLLGRFIDVCQAMQYAHDRGVLHRDLKPGNIMLGKYGETLVVDWGLAKASGHRSESEPQTSVSIDAPLRPSSGSAETIAGSAVGTPAFMSPEQAAGHLDQLGAASDVYSLGATMYTLLTGKLSVEHRDLGVVLKKVQQGDIRKPRAVKPDVPAALEAICLNAMALQPVDRYGSPQELANDVERWLADEPVCAYREPMRVRVRRWGRKHKTLVAAAASLVVAAVPLLTIGLVLLQLEDGRTKDALALAIRNEGLADKRRDEARHQAYAAQINLAQRIWEEGEIPKLLQLLKGTEPKDASDQDLRSLEWHYLWSACHRHSHALEGQLGTFCAVTLSANGSRLATGTRIFDAKAKRFTSTDVTVWDLDLHQKAHRIDCEGNDVGSVAFSPDGKYLAAAIRGRQGEVGHWRGAVQVWDARTGKNLHKFQSAVGTVNTVAFHPDNRHLACTVIGALENQKPTLGEIVLWDLNTGKDKLHLSARGNFASGVAFSSDGRSLVAGFNDHHFDARRWTGGIQLWNVESGEEVRVFGSVLVLRC